MNKTKRYSGLVLLAKNMWKTALKLGICQFCHGKSAPAKRLSHGDFVIYYSSKITMAGSDLYQKFTAIEVIDDAPYQVKIWDIVQTI